MSLFINTFVGAFLFLMLAGSIISCFVFLPDIVFYSDRGPKFIILVLLGVILGFSLEIAALVSFIK